MYSIKAESHFSAAHNLRDYKGKCEELHGHNWKVEAEVEAEKLDAIGMVVDFTFIKAELKKIMEVLDHTYINNVPYFKEVNPTSENIAKYIYDVLKARVPGLQSVTVWESEKSSARYEES